MNVQTTTQLKDAIRLQYITATGELKTKIFSAEVVAQTKDYPVKNLASRVLGFLTDPIMGFNTKLTIFSDSKLKRETTAKYDCISTDHLQLDISHGLVQNFDYPSTDLTSLEDAIVQFLQEVFSVSTDCTISLRLYGKDVANMSATIPVLFIHDSRFDSAQLNVQISKDGVLADSSVGEEAATKILQAIVENSDKVFAPSISETTLDSGDTASLSPNLKLTTKNIDFGTPIDRVAEYIIDQFTAIEGLTDYNVSVTIGDSIYSK